MTGKEKKKSIKIKKEPEKKEIINIISKLKGNIKQKPPIYSAVKIKGIRSYKLARLNKNVKMKSRTVYVKKINLKKYKYPELALEITCGPGFYVRSLARDIGIKLKTGAYLKKLKRTKSGEFLLKDAISINKFKKIIK